MKYEVLANNIKKYRKKMNLTQKELGNKILKSEITIRKYESGFVNIPPATLFDLSFALDVPAKILLGDDMIKYTHENTTSIMDISKATTNKLLQVTEEYKMNGESWKNKVIDIETKPSHLLDSILKFLENNEEYYSSIFVDILDKKDNDLPCFTNKQINDIIKKVTELVKYEIYKIETSNNDKSK